MSKQSNRLWVRVAPDNPIWDIDVSERSRTVDHWLRIGYNTERLEKAVAELNRQIQLINSGQITINNLPEVNKGFKGEMKLINQIMNREGQ